MHLPSTRNLCQDIGDKKRYDFQTVFSPYSTGNIYRGIRAKCLGCKICYMHHQEGGFGREPEPVEKLLPKLQESVKQGRTELITDLIEPFLNWKKIIPLILKIHEEIPEAKFNLITKLPLEARMAINAFPEFNDLPYHIQVTTMRDGRPTSLNIVQQVQQLSWRAKSVSCRVDPFVFGISRLYEFLDQIAKLSRIGIIRITTNTMKVYRGQKKLLPKLDLTVYSDGDKAGTARIVNADLEYQYFQTISRQCKKHHVGLGICMSRPEVRVFETAPCEGIGLNEYG